MPRNDRSDSFSVRDEDDPRREVKALEQEAELEFGASEAHDTGGVEHQSEQDREGHAARGARPRTTSPEDVPSSPGSSEPTPRAAPGRAPDAPDGNEHP